MASGGYPRAYEKGKRITGLEQFEGDPDVEVFHGGTARSGSGVETNGGRVLGVTARGPDVATARRQAYAAADKIHFEGAHFRRDIADRALSR